MKREVCEACPVDTCRIYYYVNGFVPSGGKIDYVHVYSRKKYDEMGVMDEIHDNYVCDRYVLKKGGRLFLRRAIYEDSLFSDFEWELDGCLPSNVESYDDCPCIMEHKIDAWNRKSEKK
jgi:hypothetical protein